MEGPMWTQAAPESHPQAGVVGTSRCPDPIGRDASPHVSGCGKVLAFKQRQDHNQEGGVALEGTAPYSL